jgi:hypothetical protein
MGLGMSRNENGGAAIAFSCGVLQYGSKDVCDTEKDDETGRVSCADPCNASGVNAASSKFNDDFTGAFRTATRGAACEQQGEQDWAADDRALSHQAGTNGGDGTWGCSGTGCSGGGLMYGPYVSLPPGSYAAGVTGVSGGSFAMASLDVTSDKGKTTLATATFSPSQFSGQLTMAFKVTAIVDDVEVRIPIGSTSKTSVQVGGAFIRRQ